MVSLQQTVRNHFVPKFSTRPWLLDEDHFIELTKCGNDIVGDRSGPKAFGYEENLYSQVVEDAFGKIENRIVSIQRKLAVGQILSTAERHAWSMWLLASYLRTPLAMLNSADTNQAVGSFRGDVLRVGASRLVALATNPHCIELLADRRWEVLQSRDPVWLKPDTGLVLTGRLDADDCLVIYPLSPFACFLASGRGFSYQSHRVNAKRAAGINRQILRWTERSVACAAAMWNKKRRNLITAVRNYLGTGQYSHPAKGNFFAPEGVDLGESLELMMLAPRGPVMMKVAKTTVRSVSRAVPKIPGLYSLDSLPESRIEVRFSDDESEIDFTSAAILMKEEHDRTDLAIKYASQALQKKPNDLIAKLIILQHDPNAKVGDLTPQSPLDAANLGLWLSRVKNSPKEGLALTSAWLRRFPEDNALVGANFLCAFMTYGARLFEFLTGREQSLPYMDVNTPLPDGIIEFMRKVYQSGNSDLIADLQGSLADIDERETGLVADLLRLCGCNSRLRLFRKE